MTVSRRNVVKTAAWTAPAIVVATAAPAFATSENGPSCTPTGYKKPGLGQNTKDYFLQPGCDSGQVASVHIDNQQTVLTNEGYALYGQKDSSNFAVVLITFVDGSQWGPQQVAFPPFKG